MNPLNVAVWLAVGAAVYRLCGPVERLREGRYPYTRHRRYADDAVALVGWLLVIVVLVMFVGSGDAARLCRP